MKKTTKMKNRIAIVVDGSGSMSGIMNEAVTMVNDTIKNLAKENKKWKQETSVDVIAFDSDIQVPVENTNVRLVRTLKRSDLYSGGSTALFDAVGKALSDFVNSDEYLDTSYSFVVVVITDGYENASRKFDNVKLTKLVKECQATDRFTITFQTPESGKQHLKALGIPPANIRDWEVGTVEGIKDVGQTLTSGFSSYYGSRSRGLTSVKDFYSPDLSKVTTQDLKKLEEQTDDFTVLSVPKECIIKDFVQTKTGIPYSPGVGFYQLTKAETVQAAKNIAVMDKRNGKIYSGAKARQLIGIPTNKTIKIEPGNHNYYEIFVQSTSVNRKLVRGTKLLVRK